MSKQHGIRPSYIREHDLIEPCGICRCPVRRSPNAATETDGSGAPKHDTRLWWHDGFPLPIYARGTMPVSGVSHFLHIQNPEESDKLAAEAAAASIPSTEATTLIDVEYVASPADEWAAIRDALRAAVLVSDVSRSHIRSIQSDSVLGVLSVLESAVRALPMADELRAEYAERAVVAAGGSVRPGTAVGASDVRADVMSADDGIEL